ncbi:Gfo/Idh/MocA family oxidoreductase [Streptomyces montanus]|uniref:Gfo/Idh/MocA family protein n=1 Tax=Streptomyces montanus TaxID=2580423 RepID=UPI00268C5722
MAAPRRIAVIGLGAISRFYLAAIEESAAAWQLAAVCDVSPERLAPHRDRCPVFTDHRALLAEARLDAVVVAVPNDRHAAITADVLAAGLPVCVEKPLATRAADAEALVEQARARGVCLFTAFHRRYNREVRRLVRELRAGAAPAELAIRYFERIEEHIGDDAWYLDPARCGGGCVADNGPNAYDLARLLAGEVRVEHAEVVRDRFGTDRRATVRLRSRAGLPVRVELDWSYPGEVKDVTVRLADGAVRTADMLRGFRAFKGSLWHEYVGVLDDFDHAIRMATDRTGDGLVALSLVEETYRLACHPPARVPGSRGRPAEDGDQPMHRESRQPMNGESHEPMHGESAVKHATHGTLVKVLTHRRDDRGMRLEDFASRCVRRGEIHELVTTDQRETAPGTRVDRVGFLGFAEMGCGGVLDRGDRVWIDGRPVGTVLGFDSCHFPNHYNILISVPEPVTGRDLALAPRADVRFVPAATAAGPDGTTEMPEEEIEELR